MKNIKSNILWGISFILAGIILMGKTFGICNFFFYRFDGWWTMFIIVPCCISLMNHGAKRGNVIGLVIGFLLLLDQVDLIQSISIFDLAIPIILIIMGVYVLLK